MEFLNFDRTVCYDSEQGTDLVANLYNLTKDAILAYSDKSKLPANYYERCEVARLDWLDYSAKCANIPVEKVKTYEGFKKAMNTYSAFQEHYFSIATQVLDKINSKAELQEAMQFIDVKSLGEGDSSTYEIGSKALFTVEEVGYGDLGSTRFQYQWYDNKILLPKNYDCSVAMDVYQSASQGHDSGRMLAKVAISQRAKMYSDVFDKVMDNASLIGTPFVKDTFSKVGYQTLARNISLINGGTVFAFGTNLAYGKIADGLDAKWTFQNSNEYLKSGMIGDLYGVNSIVLDNAMKAYQSYTTSVPTVIPDDRIVLLSTNVPDKIGKMVIEEGQNSVIFDNGATNNIQLKTFKVRSSWNVDLISQAVRGMQLV